MLIYRIAEDVHGQKKVGNPCAWQRCFKNSTNETKRLFCKNVMQYCITVRSVLHVNTTASDFKFLFVFSLSQYSWKHDAVNGNPN